MTFWKKKQPSFTVTFRDRGEVDCTLAALLHTYAMVKTMKNLTNDEKYARHCTRISRTIETIQRAKNSFVKN